MWKNVCCKKVNLRTLTSFPKVYGQWTFWMSQCKAGNTLALRQAAHRTMQPQCATIRYRIQPILAHMNSLGLSHVYATWAIDCRSIKVSTGWGECYTSQISCEHAVPRINAFAFFVSRQITSQRCTACQGCLIQCMACLSASVFSA